MVQKDLNEKLQKDRDNIFKEIRKTLKQHTCILHSIENIMKCHREMYQRDKANMEKSKARIVILDKA